MKGGWTVANTGPQDPTGLSELRGSALKLERGGVAASETMLFGLRTSAIPEYVLAALCRRQ